MVLGRVTWAEGMFTARPSVSGADPQAEHRGTERNHHQQDRKGGPRDLYGASQQIPDPHEESARGQAAVTKYEDW